MQTHPSILEVIINSSIFDMNEARIDELLASLDEFLIIKHFLFSHPSLGDYAKRIFFYSNNKTCQDHGIKKLPS